MRALSVLALVLLAGCFHPPAADPVPQATPSATPTRTYELNVVVTQETPDGAPVAARVDVLPVLPGPAFGPMIPQTTLGGVAHYSFREPATLLVRAVAAGGWTTEGARVQVGDVVTAEGAMVSDRDLFLPLFHDRLELAVQHEWGTATATLGGDPAVTFVPLGLPQDTKGTYLARLVDATVTVSWSDGPDGQVGTMATGLAWDGRAWVTGPESSPLDATGQRRATWDGDLPADRPADLEAAQLQAVLQTSTALVGQVLFDVQVTLVFGDHVPPELPNDDCHLLC